MKKWFFGLSGNSAASYRMFAFPFSGGNAMSYADWKHWLRPDIQLFGAQLPGRGMRMNEPLISDMQELVAHLTASLKPLLDRPYFLYGHSNGALMAFLVANALLGEGHPKPEAIMISAKQSPIRDSPREQLSCLPDEQFLKRLKAMGGTHEELLENPEVMELLMPVIRNDFSLGETYLMPDIHPVLGSIPALILAGESDEIAVETVFSWGDLFPANEKIALAGGHFFINTNPGFAQKVAGFLDERIARLTTSERDTVSLR